MIASNFFTDTFKHVIETNAHVTSESDHTTLLKHPNVDALPLFLTQGAYFRISQELEDIAAFNGGETRPRLRPQRREQRFPHEYSFFKSILGLVLRNKLQAV